MHKSTDAEATLAPKLKKEVGLIDWRKPAHEFAIGHRLQPGMML